MKRLMGLLMAMIMIAAGVCAYGAEETITLPQGIKVINAETFLGDTGMDHVIIPSGVERIESKAFSGCTLGTLELPASLTYIAEDAFEGTTVETWSADESSYALSWGRSHGLAEYPSATVGEQTLEIAAGATVRVPFTVPESGSYVFETTGTIDTEGELYNESGKRLTADSDNGAQTNFKMKYNLCIGEKVYVEVSYFEKTDAGSTTLKVSYTAFNDTLNIGMNTLYYSGPLTRGVFTAPFTGIFDIQLEPDTTEARVSFTENDPDAMTFKGNTAVYREEGQQILLDVAIAKADRTVKISIYGEHEEGEETVYRALLIGQTYDDLGEDYQLTGCEFDASAMATLLNNMEGTPYSVTYEHDLTKSQITAAIESAFSDADEDDVSLFYYSGHGFSNGSLLGSDNVKLTVAELKTALDAVAGTKIVIMDSCYSGTVIKGARTLSESDSFNDAIINAFSSSGLRAKGVLSESPYYVLTACSSTQKSYAYTYGSVFTLRLTLGSGFNEKTMCFTGSMPADANSDGSVTLEEAYSDAIRNIKVEGQTTQRYPTGSSYVLWTKDAPEEDTTEG